ncbi:glycosyltransferase [Marivita hallyeonensis]|uniref:Glycosyl transferases group 1 n=1 Tax=Marivita hallyeonensis TaxID=996342 RepID=A0A1M5Y5K0_9RHOB|nr:glycosyltransferase [Marivita hallyeonensis]SHI07361.1 Glycosyl transferases group 1 [Marivita hallyeonensis]
MRWPDRLGRALRRLTGRRDYLDGIQGGAIVGWALPKPGAGPVPVALYDGPVRLADALAHQFRADLRDAGLAEGRCGFAFALPEHAQDLRVCRLDGPRPIEIGRLAWDPRDPRASPARVQAARPASPRHDMPGLAALRAPPRPARAGRTALTPRQALLFDETDPETGAPLPGPLSAYLAYLRPRHRLETQFDWDSAPEEAAHFLNWMLTSYAPMRAGLRPPLSARCIGWLNAPVVIPGQRTHLSRATWAALQAVPHLRQGMDFGNPGWVDSVIYWWAVHQAPALSAEDCLVPDAYVTRLAGRPEDGPFPLSRYLLRWVEETPAMAQFSTTRKEDRRQITLAAMVRAAERPDTLRYIPWASIETLLVQDSDGQTPLGAYARTLDRQDRRITPRDYAACLRGRGYDMDARRFTTRTAEGHRLHAAALPAPALQDAVPVDLQVIGPVTKASGLGQAMRAAVAALQTTGMDVQVVNFDLDNPAPDTDVPHVPFAEARPARISLVHLNAESLPLLTAYAPDLTDGSYTAAYMFWELTRPATCHALALKMVDEIWAASDHGKAIYAEAFDGPVRVMGLANTVAPAADPLGARAGFVARTGFTADSFLCMASFDSFSFVQRKNPLGLIRAFRDAFPQGGAQLLLKTQNRARVSDLAQHKVWAEIDALTKGDARFRILDETLDRDALLALTAGADAYLSLHRAEGWGFGMIEAMALGVPVLATGYSGNLAYCEDRTAWLVPAAEVAPAPQDYMFTPDGGLWGEPDHRAAVTLLRQMQGEPDLRARKARAAQARVLRDFSAEAIGKRYATRIETMLRQGKAPKTDRAA